MNQENKQVEESFSMNIDAYLVELYQQQGYEVAFAAALDFIKITEADHIHPINDAYDAGGIPITRTQFATLMLEGLNIFPTEPCIDQEEAIYGPNDDWQVEDDKEFLKAIEGLIRQQYNEYKAAKGELARLEQLRESISDVLARNISYWAHFRLRKPAKNHQDVSLYLTAKQVLLRSVIPGYGAFRSLSNKIKYADTWGRIGVDSTGAAGICNSNDAENGNSVPLNPDNLSC